MQNYVVRQQEGLWEVWLGDRLVSGQPTYDQALAIAVNLADAATARGERAKVVLGVTEPAKRRATAITTITESAVSFQARPPHASAALPAIRS